MQTDIEFSTSPRGDIISAKQGGKRVSRIPAKILSYLYANLNQTVSKEDVCMAAWGEHNYFIRRSMDVHLYKLRAFLEDSGLILYAGSHQCLTLMFDKQKQEQYFSDKKAIRVGSTICSSKGNIHIFRSEIGKKPVYFEVPEKEATTFRAVEAAKLLSKWVI